ncbi:DNA translocase FtsK [Tropicimonas sp. IMCC34043]|uniref:DNA translocase FtsK n=1 Tax=Tropicimonas sp. IMCC34043 TaxID=2248760 RepID=UPI000E242238|nr:DNA translocase FtsK [Tropicimonas sp. IMCC34043]
MASYQTRQRDPLLDSSTQEAIEKRGRELLGIALVLLAGAIAAMLASYSPQDPSFFAASDGPVRNMLGSIGAAIAAPLFVVVGFGAWVLAPAALAWGIRLLFNLGADRLLARVIFTPIALALAAVYASTIVPSDGWEHSFGLGGLFGDTVLGAILNLLPISASSGLRMLAVPIWAGAVVMLLFVAGFNPGELRRILRFVSVGMILGYDALMRLAGRGVAGTSNAARDMVERRARHAEARGTAAADTVAGPVERRAEPVVRRAAADADDFVIEDDDDALSDDDRGRAPGGLFSSVTALIRRGPAESIELPDQEAVEEEDDREDLPVDFPSEDHIRSRIADAIRLRGRKGSGNSVTPRSEPTLGRVEPPVVRRRRPDPLILKVPGAVPPAPMAEIDDMPVAPLPPMQRVATPAPKSAIIVEDDADDFDDDDFGQKIPDRDSVSGPQVTPRILPRAIPVEEARAVVQHPPRGPIPTSRKAQAEAQPRLKLEPAEPEAYDAPPLSLLTNPNMIERHVLSDEALEENARMLENVLDDYGVKGEIVSVRPGPVVTMYELEPAPGLKASRVIGLSDDIARSMSALSARVSTVPGRSVIGIELPNVNREKVVLREILSARAFGDTSMPLPLALGKDIGGAPVVANLAKMPHLLIAGTTGSGKSVAINTMIVSLLYRLSPQECRMIMIDPKMLELSVYDGIPHLLSPVVTDPKKAVVALKWVVGEMEDRYRKMSKMGVRNIEGFNGRVHEALAKGEMFSRTVQTGFDDETGEPVFETEEFAPELLPFIVVVVDEMADLMMVAGKEIEACIQRLAQMARASGIHLIMATQRPSVDVITGTIKANFPTRISFQVTSKIDSRTILGEMGAEQLLGMGDMLYMAGGGKLTRVHGPFVSDEEVEEIVNHLKALGPPEYVGSVVEGPDEDREGDIDLVLGLGGNTDGEDALYDQAVAIVLKDRKCSTSYIQRKLAIGYNKAARLVEQMEDEGLVSASNHVGKREILVPEQG